MDEGLSYETLPVSVPSQGLTHLVLISLSGYLNIHGKYSGHIQEGMQKGASRQIQMRNLCSSKAYVSTYNISDVLTS